MGSMIIVMKSDATQEDVDRVLARLESIGSEAHVSVGQTHTVIGVIGDRDRIQQLPWEALSGVERAVPVLKPFKFVSRDYLDTDTVIEVRGVRVGGGYFAVVDGQCAVDSRDQLFRVAEAVQQTGNHTLPFH